MLVELQQHAAQLPSYQFGCEDWEHGEHCLALIHEFRGGAELKRAKQNKMKRVVQFGSAT